MSISFVIRYWTSVIKGLFGRRILRSYRSIRALRDQLNELIQEEEFLTTADLLNMRSKLGILGREASKLDTLCSVRKRSRQRAHFSRMLKQLSDEVESYRSRHKQRMADRYSSLLNTNERPLDRAQLEAVLNEDRRTLLVAGAGSGKTHVLTSKILFASKRAEDRNRQTRLLALVFQNKARREIEARLARHRVAVEIETFHSFCLKLLKARNPGGIKVISEAEATRIVDTLASEALKSSQFQNHYYAFLQKYGSNSITEFDREAEQTEYVAEQQKLRYIALNGIEYKSQAEQQIANFFLVHSLGGARIQFLYEDPAPWMDLRRKDGSPVRPDFYLPDFDIYLEHWGTDRKGNTASWIRKDAYLSSRKAKLAEFAKHGKTLIQTDHDDFLSGRFSEILATKLIHALKTKGQDQPLYPRTHEEIKKETWEAADVMSNLARYIFQFITRGKTLGLEPNGIKDRLTTYSADQREFAAMALFVWQAYSQELKSRNGIDFNDMINLAVDVIPVESEFLRPNYAYIFVDEFQDLSAQRLKVLEALLARESDTKLFCTGDDWQGIMGFSGASPEYLIHFEDHFGVSSILKLESNYRSVSSIVDLGNEVMRPILRYHVAKDPRAVSEERIKIIAYEAPRSRSDRKNLELVIERILKAVKELMAGHGLQYSDFMVLSRYNPTPWVRETLGKLSRIHDVPITFDLANGKSVPFMTVHKSKGLEAKVVFLTGLAEGMYGFPAQVQTSKLFEPVMGSSNQASLQDQEERRLFYVAVTRARRTLVCFTEKNNRSRFLEELGDRIEYRPLR